MLKNERDSSNIKSSKDQAKNFMPSNLLHYFVDTSNVARLIILLWSIQKIQNQLN